MNSTTIAAPELIRRLRPRVMAFARQTPLLRFDAAGVEGEVWLKLENLQVTGSYKVRPAAGALAGREPASLREGVVTASSGNFGIGLARVAAGMGVSATVIVPEDAPAAKLDQLASLGAGICRVPYDEWWAAILSREHPGVSGSFVDPVGETYAQAANGSIGLEILEALPDADVIFVPFGGGGLICGIAAAVKAAAPGVRIVACESELAAPLTAAFEAGRPVEVPLRHGFITGIGARQVLPSMWPLLRSLVDDVAVVSLEETANAIRRMALDAHVIAEGAGAVSVAAALSAKAGGRKVACVVSGGNIGAEDLRSILTGNLP